MLTSDDFYKWTYSGPGVTKAVKLEKVASYNGIIKN